ncbi:hypothetical protein [Shinella sp. M27]|uniref:hypothetical protein n=1 Tax=Shinella sp. M27 TaxID=3368614 RepID=UPI003BA1A4FD
MSLYCNACQPIRAIPAAGFVISAVAVPFVVAAKADQRVVDLSAGQRVEMA